MPLKRLGRLDDGTGYYAPLGELVYDPDADRVQCHLCGRWFRQLTWSHLHRHGWNNDDYVRAFGLNLHRGLITPTLAAQKAQVMRARMATDPRIQGAMDLIAAIARDPEARAKIPRTQYYSLEHRRNSGRGIAAQRAGERRQEEELLGRRLGFSDFDSYVQARRGQGWTAARIGTELGRTDWWVRRALLRIEGRRTLKPDEFRRVKSASAKRSADQRATGAKRQVEQRARGLGFEGLTDYLLDRRLRGWGQANIADDLQVGQRRAVRLLQAERLWNPRPRRAPRGLSDDVPDRGGYPALGRAGALIRRRRDELGLSLAQLSARTGLSVAILFCIEHAKRRIPLDAWVNLRITLGIAERLPREIWDWGAGRDGDEVTRKLRAYRETIHGGGLAELLVETECSLDEVRHRLKPLLAEAVIGRGRFR